MGKEELPSKQVFIIRCRTGCTCCSGDNHYRGPYKTREEAERRIKYFFAETSKFWPTASQYAKRGHYSVEEVKIEFLPDGRAIMQGVVLDETPVFIVVKEDGSVFDNDAEQQLDDLDCY